MEIDDDLEDVEELIESFKSALSKRKQGTVIRLIVNKDIDPDLIAFATEELHIRPSDIFKMDGLLNLSDLEQISSKKMPQLKFVPFSPSVPAYLKDGDIFTAIREKDILLHHPYESFDPVIDFLTQAAKDPNVVSIKQTLYRTSEDSPIVKALAQAAEAGKSVTVMVELKARFDEEKNIKLAGVLEKSGAQVVFGFMKYKTHSKMILVTRKEEGQLRSYAHFGTGNYHPQTAKIYTDISVFTADPVLTRDAAKIFNYVTGYVRPDSLEKISISPLNLKIDLFSLIDTEIENAKEGKPAHIIAKLNALVDSDIIDKLYSASAAGVKVDLIVRGICCLKPGLKGLSENIKVRSIIGRFLEHSRIVCFANGSRIPSTRAKVFLSSADWMPRSFIRRVESMIPLEDPVIHKRILEEVIFYNLADNEQSWLLKSDGTYERMHVLSDKVNIHQTFLNLAKDANL
jgi:polyphosphate kinase